MSFTIAPVKPTKPVIATRTQAEQLDVYELFSVTSLHTGSSMEVQICCHADSELLKKLRQLASYTTIDGYLASFAYQLPAVLAKARAILASFGCTEVGPHTLAELVAAKAFRQGTRVCGPHGPGTIAEVRTNAATRGDYLSEARDFAALAQAGSFCLPILVEGFYSAAHYPFVVQFDCGYRDVYSCRSLTALQPGEVEEFHDCHQARVTALETVILNGGLDALVAIEELGGLATRFPRLEANLMAAKEVFDLHGAQPAALCTV